MCHKAWNKDNDYIVHCIMGIFIHITCMNIKNHSGNIRFVYNRDFELLSTIRCWYHYKPTNWWMHWRVVSEKIEVWFDSK